MTTKNIRSLTAAAIALAALIPASASASTLTVDDDKVQCPSAGFTNLQTAINQAAPWDTIKICDGTYASVTNTPNATNSPAATGSRAGFLITKPLTLKGAGADKVTIKPTPGSGTLAGATPYLRDGGGAVLQINRQSGGSSDYTENFVDISGVTISSPDGVYADAAVSFFNTSGTISNSVIGPLSVITDPLDLVTKPYGYGVLMVNSLQGASEAAVRRELNIVNSTITGFQAGGVLFDDARGADATPSNTLRSGIIAYGTVIGTKVIGSGAQAIYPQTGVQYHAGARGSVVGSSITGNNYTTDPRKSVGILLTDADTGPDGTNPAVRAFFARGNAITGNGWGVFNANITNDAVKTGGPASLTGPTADEENFFGCATGPVIGGPSAGGCDSVSGADSTPAPSVELGASPRTSAPTVAGATAVADSAPTGSIVDPAEGADAPSGVATPVTVSAADDFGVAKVELKVNGTVVGSDTTTPYVIDWTPTLAQIDHVYDLTAVITDSSGQTTTTAVRHLFVPVPAGYVALTASPTSYDFGSVYVGSTAHQLITLTNTGAQDAVVGTPSTSGSSEFAVNPALGTCTSTPLAPSASCTVDVSFTPVDDPVESSTLTIPYTAPGGTSPITIALTAKGPTTTSTPETVSATVNSTLGLTVSSATTSLGSFIPGIADDYESTLTLGVTTTGGASKLVASDPSATNTGHLVNGAYVLSQALQAKATNTATPSSVFGPIGSTTSPLTLLSYGAPVSNDAVTVTFKQPIPATEPLRTGTYAKTVMFTVATTTP